jgi:hypothetical protein
MLKAYGLGFLIATVAVVLVAVTPIGLQERQQPGLLWGDRVYSSEQEFKGYLKSKGLSYETWLARNPGAAPWEPDEIAFGFVTVRVSTEARERWVVRLPLVALGLAIATGCALLGLRRVRRVMPSRVRRSVAFVSAALTVLLVVGIWLGTQPRREAGLLWGDKVYTSKEEFKGYLKSKGLTYSTWVARNPGAAPWEPASARPSPEQSRGWLGRALVAVLGSIVGIACALLLLWRWRPAIRAFARGSPAFFGPRVPRSGNSPAAGPPAFASIRPFGVAAFASIRRFGVAAFASIRRFGVAAVGAAHPRGASALMYMERLVRTASARARLLSRLMPERHISVGDVAFCLLLVTTAVVFGLFVTVLMSA